MSFQTTSSDCCSSVGHEKELVESKLEQERKLFEVQMKTLLTDYDKLMKDNQSTVSNSSSSPRSSLSTSVELLTRYNETKTILNEFEKKTQLSSRTHEFPNPQRVEHVHFILSSYICNIL